MVGPGGRRLLEEALCFCVLVEQPLRFVTELGLALFKRFARVTQRLVRRAEARAQLQRAFVRRWRGLEATRGPPFARAIAVPAAPSTLRLLARVRVRAAIGVWRAVRPPGCARSLSTAVNRRSPPSRAPVDAAADPFWPGWGALRPLAGWPGRAGQAPGITGRALAWLWTAPSAASAAAALRVIAHNRRVATVVVSHSGYGRVAAMKLRDIPTPALVVDLPVMERNIERMASYFASRPAKLRPHFKAHKTPAIALRQLAAGSCTGLTCATIGEAEVIAFAGLCEQVLIANELVGPGKAARAAALARTVDLIVAVDSDAALMELAGAARAAGTTVGVLVDVNVGLPRCGIAPGEPALALARRAAEMRGVELRGAMGYEGHIMGIRERAERQARAVRAMERLLSTVALIRGDGLPCEIVSAGGTCTYDITGAMEGITEVQAGTYALMDTAYTYDDLPFELALSIHATVLSRPRPDQCAADAGLKACAVDHGNPLVRGIDGASVMFLSDEHATIALPADAGIAVGDRIELWPSHIDPTVNLHDVIYAARGDEVVEVWEVAARGYRLPANVAAGIRS